jgi:hypothetical protein
MCEPRSSPPQAKHRRRVAIRAGDAAFPAWPLKLRLESPDFRENISRVVFNEGPPAETKTMKVEIGESKIDVLLCKRRLVFLSTENRATR